MPFDLNHRPSAKRLILSVLSQPNIQELHIRQLIKWGDLFDHRSATIRVEAGRLTKQCLLETTSRGVYKIGTAGDVLKQTASAWDSIADQVGEWNGGWLCIHTAHLGRSDKSALQARERAFRLMGFEQLVTGLWCRPDNLIAAASATFVRLIQFGLEPDAILVRMEAANNCNTIDPHALWPRKPLESNYRGMIELMEDSRERLGNLDMGQAMRQSFLVGEHVIRQINADPLLPSEMVDTDLRNKMIAGMKRYSAHCHPIWAQFLDQSVSR